jgi:uncharacterized protein with HEPN domain
MRPKTAAALFDIRIAVERVRETVATTNLKEFEASWIVQSAVERQFEILGEALTRIKSLEPAIFEEIPDASKVISLRNLIAHGYDAVDSKVLWSTAIEHLPTLEGAVLELLAQAERQGL